MTSLFDKAKAAVNAHFERERAERPKRIKEWKEKTVELRAEAGYARAKRSLEKARGGGGSIMSGGDIGGLFMGASSSRKKHSTDPFGW